MGDFNLDTLLYNHHMPTQEFIGSLYPSRKFLLLISNSRRLTSYSAILIDNIFTYQLPNDVYNDILLNDLSDRFPVFTYFHDEQLSPTGGKKFF